MKSIAVILIILFVLYFAYVGYKFMVLNGISSKLEQYKYLDNYYFKKESIIDNELQETREVWYKDGCYKIIEVRNVDAVASTTITYLDVNNNKMYMINNEENTYIEMELYDITQYENGKFMYTFFPSIVNKGATDFKEWAFKLNLIFAYYKNESLLLKINDECMEFNKNNFLPIIQSIVLKENKNVQRNLYKYDIQPNIVNNEDVTIPSDYIKMN